MRFVLVCVAGLLLASCQSVATTPVNPDEIAAPLTNVPGDVARGKKLVVSREGGHCILCHAVPEADVPLTGNIAPPLNGVGGRLNAAQLRRRVVDITVIRPDATMPAFHRLDGLQKVAPEYQGKTVLGAQDVEDVVAYLGSLR